MLPSSGTDGGEADLLVVLVLVTCSDGVSPRIIGSPLKRLVLLFDFSFLFFAF